MRSYRDRLQQSREKHRCLLHAYVLMTNHVHLLLTPETKGSISKMIPMLGRYYVQYFNDIYERTGTLWEGRYKSTLIDSENYLLTGYRYIELNPVRAIDMAGHPAEYPWSSYGFNALGKEALLITPHEEYLRLGKTATDRQKAYRALFKLRIPDRTLENIRESTNKAWVLGSDYFKEHIEKQSFFRNNLNFRGLKSKYEKVTGSNDFCFYY
jgi:putative transposase